MTCVYITTPGYTNVLPRTEHVIIIFNSRNEHIMCHRDEEVKVAGEFYF